MPLSTRVEGQEASGNQVIADLVPMGQPILPPSPCLNITFVSVMGNIFLGVASTPEAMANPGRYIELLLDSVDKLEHALIPARGAGMRTAAKKVTPKKSVRKKPAAKKTAVKKTAAKRTAAKKAATKKNPARTTRKKAPVARRAKARAVPKNRSSVS